VPTTTDELAASNIAASLFIGTPEDQVRQTIGAVREILQRGVATAFIALLGRGREPGTRAAIWPIALPLAPFIDAALLGDADERDAHHG
jgi:hypothetical protein